MCSLIHALKHLPITGVGINQTKYGNATRFGKKADKKDFEETYEFELAVPPMLADKSQEAQTAFLKELLKGATQKYHVTRQGRPALGMQRVLQQKFLDAPAQSGRGNQAHAEGPPGVHRRVHRRSTAIIA
ncbi:MAG: hypothetical protein JXR45_10270 [Deltaproteobacteria bacterium]|nr:hypothetical protein [Deltaproteobacteria bacterium]